MPSSSAYLFVLRNVLSSIIDVGFATVFWILLGLVLIASVLSFGLFVLLVASPIIYCAGGFDYPKARASIEANANDNTNGDLEANIETSEAAPLATPMVVAQEGSNIELPVRIYEFDISTQADLAAPVEERTPTDSENSTDSAESETYCKGDDFDLEELDPLFEEPFKNEK
ncbi:hypothetical protein N7G274_005604 [Stereocaulon virgatum]|uniref:Uncharacterized protein n=1 Tax=Stereocaulon virgatum TaxID=373712 RepID=A0ABR4A9M9_9LECA